MLKKIFKPKHHKYFVAYTGFQIPIVEVPEGAPQPAGLVPERTFGNIEITTLGKLDDGIKLREVQIKIKEHTGIPMPILTFFCEIK